MQINNTQCPYPKSTSFGMAVKITKGGADYLRKQGTATLEKLSTIGDEMKDYKHWDLFVTEDGFVARPKANMKNGFKDFVRIDPSNIFPSSGQIRIESRYSDFGNKGEEANILIEGLKDGEAVKIAQKIKEETTLGRFAELIRLLEKRDAKTAAEEAAKAAEEAKRSSIVNDLISKFGFDA